MGAAFRTSSCRRKRRRRFALPAHSKARAPVHRLTRERPILECGGKRSATPLSDGCCVQNLLMPPKAPSPLRSAGALQSARTRSPVDPRTAHFGVRWQAQRDTAFARVGRSEPPHAAESARTSSQMHFHSYVDRLFITMNESPDPDSRPSAPQTPWPHAPLHQLSQRGTYFVTVGTYRKQHHFRGAARLGVPASRSADGGGGIRLADGSLGGVFQSLSFCRPFSGHGGGRGRFVADARWVARTDGQMVE